MALKTIEPKYLLCKSNKTPHLIADEITQRQYTSSFFQIIRNRRQLARNTTNPASAKDSGILIQRGGNNAFMGFCEQEDKFVMCMK